MKKVPGSFFGPCCVIIGVFATGCQSTHEKDVLLVKDRVEKLRPLSDWKPLRCEVKTELAAGQKQKYMTAFPEEKDKPESWEAVYDWTARRSRCEVRPKNLTPITANQRTFIEEAFCTLMQVFWVHSPFDDLKFEEKDIEDRDTEIFLRQKDNSDLGLYVNKTNVEIHTKTAHKGTYSAQYSMQGPYWLPREILHETFTFSIQLKDFEWEVGQFRSPPKSFWIHVGDRMQPEPHTHVLVGECKPY